MKAMHGAALDKNMLGAGLD